MSLVFWLVLAYVMGILTSPLLFWIKSTIDKVKFYRTPLGRSIASTNKFYGTNWIEDLITPEQAQIMYENNVSVFATGCGGVRAYRSTSSDYYDDVLADIEVVTISLFSDENSSLYEIDFAATGENIKEWIANWISSGCQLPDKRKR